MITKRQKQALDFIENYIGKHGFAPSLEEIKNHLGLSSVSTAHFHVSKLQKQGYITKEHNQPRTVSTEEIENIRIPFLGRIAAGKPIEAVSEAEKLAVPKNMLTKSGKHYALKVVGNSMIDEGIYDGDVVIIRNQDFVENGETAVALIDNEEVTLKKIYREKNRFRLQPANPSLKPFYANVLKIQGKVVSVLRNFEKKFELNRIICGDVLEEMKKIPDNTFHLAITSPPYNVGKDYDNHNDKMAYQDYLDWLNEVWKETKRVLVPGGRFALNIAPTGIKEFVPLHHDFTNQFRKLGMKFRTEIIWYKQTMLKRTAWGSFKSPANPHIVPSWEYVLIFSKEKDRLDGDDKMADITKHEFMKFSDGFWQIWPETQRKDHPAPFPEELIYRLIKFYSYRGSNILDMFGGTGTVAVVAVKTERNYLHIDISPQYCKVSKDRVDKELKQLKLL